MTLSPVPGQRLRFLVRVSDKEARHLAGTTDRLFAMPFTPERYVEDPLVLANALEAAHRYVPALADVTCTLTAEIEQRGWA